MSIQILACLLTLGVSAATAATIDFDRESVGPIDGTGDFKYWEVERQPIEGGSYRAAMEIRPKNPGSSDLILGASDRAWASRVSGNGFDFPAPTAPQSVFELQFDFRTQQRYGLSVAWVGLGTDRNDNGVIEGASEGEIGVSYIMGSFVVTYPYANGNGSGPTLGSPATRIADGDWVRVRLVIDFEANNGDGWAYVETMNLSQGETVFQRTSNEGTSLGEWRKTQFNERLWNGVFMAIDQNNEVDNIMLSTHGQGTPAQLVNLSTRLFLPAGREVISGFVTGEGSSKKLLVRAIGQGLEQFGVQDFIENPVLTIFQEGSELMRLTSLRSVEDAQIARAAVTETGAFPVEGWGNVEAVVELPAGAYTFSVRNETNDPGEVLVEIYNLRE